MNWADSKIHERSGKEKREQIRKKEVSERQRDSVRGTQK